MNVHKHKHNAKNENKDTLWKMKTKIQKQKTTIYIYIYKHAQSWRLGSLKAKRLRLLKVAIKISRSSKVEKLRSLKIVVDTLEEPECV